MKDLKSILPLILVLACAIFLRFFHLTDLPFTTDEFSIIFRLDYNNIHDLIEHGVKELDNHPAGYQVFYYLYTKLFGISEVTFKLPNLILGVFSVYLIYILGKKWFNTTAGLFAASLMAFMQYAVVQSQTARMYGFGIAFILLTVLFWDKFLRATRVNIYVMAGFILFAAISCVIHYFSLLFIAILGLTGLFIVDRKKLIYYLISGFIIVLLFIPSINIFLFQLNKGGIQGWLGAFHWSFFYDYFRYLFHFSWILVIIIGLIMLVVFKFNVTEPQRRYRILTALWFLLPLMIGTFYSIFFNNVMHFKALYFSFPFLLLLLASFVKKIDSKLELVMVILLISVGSWSLMVQRIHYKLFCNDSTAFIYNNANSWAKDILPDSIDIIKCTNINGDKYYSKKNNDVQASNVVYTDSVSISQFQDYIKNNTKPYIYIGCTANASQYISIALNYYPIIVKQQYTIAAEAYLLKQDQNRNCLTDKPKGVSNNNPNSTVDTCVSLSGYIGSQNFKLDTLVFSDKDYLDLTLDAMVLDTLGGAKLVCCISNQDKIERWQATEIGDFSKYNQSGRVILSVSLFGLDLHNNLNAKVYVWNPRHAKYRIGKVNLHVRSGNPFIYASDQKIDNPINLYYKY